MAVVIGDKSETGSGVLPGLDPGERLARLRDKRHAEDELSVCMERAHILEAARSAYGDMPRIPRQTAFLRDLCEGISVVIEPEDILLGRMPETVPNADSEEMIARSPELFSDPGLPGLLDSIGIFVPEWGWLLEHGLGGIARYALDQLERSDNTDDQRALLEAMGEAMTSVSRFVRRYAAESRRQAEAESCPARKAELEAGAARCEAVAWDPPTDFVQALQLIQIVHMTMSCLIGGRDITPGRVDQYLWEYYQNDLEAGVLSREDAVCLIAMFFLRLSQMSGHGTDYDDSVRRTPCKYTHLYATVGGMDSDGRSSVNDLSFVIADAIRLLRYKEPTLLVRYHPGMDESFKRVVADLVRDRLPVTIYNDETVVKALVCQGVSEEAAYQYAHSACHNSIVPGHEAGSGPGGFHNVPKLLLLAMNGGVDPATGKAAGAETPAPAEISSFEQFLDALRMQMRHYLRGARERSERRWQQLHADACPVLASCLMKACLDKRETAWRAAPVSHLNHYFSGVATTVDSLLAIRQVVFEEQSIHLDTFVRLLADDWADNQILRERIRRRLPRYGQDLDEPSEMAKMVGTMWVEEVEAASEGLERMEMWPAFYSHLAHIRDGTRTMAT
ncbi:MAG: pyruvate formate lyase family protein, partial [Candidatus Latescibacteria bacterium]|nr:pyruvate formate lyase family protein [Candidatus Latescibacterota bacterium]